MQRTSVGGYQRVGVDDLEGRAAVPHVARGCLTDQVQYMELVLERAIRDDRLRGLRKEVGVDAELGGAVADQVEVEGTRWQVVDHPELAGRLRGHRPCSSTEAELAEAVARPEGEERVCRLLAEVQLADHLLDLVALKVVVDREDRSPGAIPLNDGA